MARETAPEQAVVAALAAAARHSSTAPSALLVAFSGGLDSTALLAACARAAVPLTIKAIHFDHAWQAASRDWATHCVAVAARLGVPCEVQRFESGVTAGESLEALGRERRYAALAARATANTCVLTAHHADDLAETFLLMALRGSGPHGLAGIAPCRPLGEGLLVRPLLDFTRAELAAYVQTLDLPFLEDPSNADDAFDRNYLRQQVLPALRQRWPGLGQTFGRVAKLQFEAATALDMLATEQLRRLGASAKHLPLADFRPLSPALQRQCLRAWVAQAEMPLPDARRLDNICAEVIGAGTDRNPVVRWQGGLVRRYDDALWLAREEGPVLAGTWVWCPEQALILPTGRLSATPTTGLGLRRSAVAAGALSVRSRHGGERLQLPGQGVHQSLKHLWQSARVPPWARARTPLIYVDDELAAVPGIGVAKAFAAAPGEASWTVQWEAHCA